MKAPTPLRAIRAKCKDCTADHLAEIKDCPITACALYPFRLGRNPNRQGIGGDSEALARARIAKN